MEPHLYVYAQIVSADDELIGQPIPVGSIPSFGWADARVRDLWTRARRPLTGEGESVRYRAFAEEDEQPV